MDTPVDFPVDPPAPSGINGHSVRARVPEPALDRTRDEQLRRLLARLEAGALDAYEYARRVRALDEARSVEAMVAIVDAPSPEPTLDPVDLAILARSASPAPTARQHRMVWVAVVGVFFVVLLGLGLWLVGHTHGVSGPGALPAAPPTAWATTSPPA